MAEIRFDSVSEFWKIWDPNTLSFIEPTSATNLSGDDTVVFNADTPTGGSFDALAGSDTYLIGGDYAGSDNPTSWDVSVTLQGVTVNDLGGSAFNMVENGLLIAEPDVL
jgi:hypothetical protein